MASDGSYGLDRIDAPDIDSKLLTELLDETWADEAEDGRLGDVMSSFEAEIGSNGPMVVIGDGEHSDDGGLEGILSDLDGRDSSTSMAYAVDDPFDWVEMEVGPSLPGDGVGGWFAGGEGGEAGTVGYGEMREYTVYYYGESESSVDQVYSPLWE